MLFKARKGSGDKDWSDRARKRVKADTTERGTTEYDRSFSRVNTKEPVQVHTSELKY